ncbi:MAG TPA: ATPase, T2SS/T4P/T4SS family [Gaiellaceae bacterium]|nr:ATPase, T2SS/T4P/T4SS family [Gaiellaceae bacterium]
MSAQALNGTAAPNGPITPTPISQLMGELVVDLLETTGLIPEGKIELLRERAKDTPVVQVLVEEGLASSEAIARIVAAQHGLPVVELGSVGIDLAAAESIALHVLEQVNAIPYAFEDDSICVAIADPQNIHGIDALRLASRQPIALRVAAAEEIANELGKLSRTAEAFGARSTLSGTVAFEVVEDEADDLEVDDGISDAPLVRLVNSILFEAAEDGASDVHFEPQADALVVRFRIDGVLHETQRIPKRSAVGVTTRLKVLAKLDIAERRKPQDGRISLSAQAAGRMLDVRVATLPTVEGESVVMRLLDKSKKPPTMEEVGLGTAMQDALGALIHRPTGALLVTGPTGSGKSTTLFAAMTEINRPEINVITVEDPVEYRLAGLNQVQINPRAGLTFATALRSILRADPDVVMVGEIRDVETAKISIEAALTGHFVLSTLHTNDAPAALTRLNEMGVEPFLTGAAVTGVLAQRLARRLCEHCKQLHTPTEEEIAAARIPDEAWHGKSELFRRNGCVRCRQTGYRGRVGIFELLTMNEELSTLAARKASHEEMQRAATEAGMKNLWADGIEKVVAGLTSLEELARVTTI